MVKNVTDLFMFELEVGEHMLASATSFATAFEAENPAHAYPKALLQLFLHASSRMRAEYDAQLHQAKQTLDARGEPFDMYLEVVAGNTPDTTFMAVPNKDADSLFLADVPENVPIVAYRFWLAVRDIEYDLSKTIFTIIQENADLQRIFVQRIRSSTAKKSANDTGAGAAQQPVANVSMYAGDAEATYSQTLSDTEAFRRIHSLEKWVHAVEPLFGHKTVSHVMHIVLDKNTAPEDNPARADIMLSPYNYFRWPLATIDAAQAQLDAYCPREGNGHVLTFPCWARVLHMSRDAQTVPGLFSLMTPDYQARCIGSAQIDNAVSRVIDARRRALVNSRRVMLGPVGNEVRLRPTVMRDIPSGEAGDIDSVLTAEVMAAFADAESGAASSQHIHHEARGFVEEQFGSVGADEHFVPRTRAVVLPKGARDRATIERMLDAIPKTNEEGEYEPIDYRSMARDDFEDASTLTSQNLMSSSDNPSRSSFHHVRYTGAQLRHELTQQSQTASDAVLRDKYMRNQHRLFTMMNNLCTRPSSNVSQEWKKMNRWFENRLADQRGWLGQENGRIDADLSTFGNVIARRMLLLESACFVTYTHRTVLLLAIGSLDAYRHAFDLHFNALMTGPNSTGKSFICELLAKLRIESTVAKVDEKTKRAGFIDDDRNDRICYTDELKLDEFRDSRGGGNDNEEASFKELLTSMVRVISTFFYLPNGRRSSRLVYSQQIMSFFGCSNVKFTGFTDAIRSRFSCLHIIEKRRDTRSTIGMQGVENDLCDALKCLKGDFVDEMQIEQYLQNLVEKMIAAHAIKDVTLKSLATLRQLVCQYLKEHFSIDVSTRTMQRAWMLTRKLVITTRLEQLFSSPASPYFGKPFDVNQLRDIDPMLYDTYEMACFAMEMLSHEMINMDRLEVMKQLHLIYIDRRLEDVRADIKSGDATKKAAALNKAASLLLTEDTSITVHKYEKRMTLNMTMRMRDDDASQKKFHSQAGAVPSRYRDRGEDVVDSVFHPVTASEAFKDETDKGHYWHAYYRFNMTLPELATELVGSAATTHVVLTTEMIIGVIRSLENERIMSRAYTYNSETGESAVNARSQPKLVPAMIVTKKDLFLAKQLFASDDPLMEALEYAQSRYVVAGTKYITATPADDEHPMLFRTRRAKPGKQHSTLNYGKQITKFAVAASEKLARNPNVRVSSGQERQRFHYDEASRRERARALYLDPDDPIMHTVDQYEQYERGESQPDDPMYSYRRRRYIRNDAGSYPECLMGADNVKTVDFDALL